MKRIGIVAFLLVFASYIASSQGLSMKKDSDVSDETLRNAEEWYQKKNKSKKKILYMTSDGTPLEIESVFIKTI